MARKILAPWTWHCAVGQFVWGCSSSWHDWPTKWPHVLELAQINCKMFSFEWFHLNSCPPYQPATNDRVPCPGKPSLEVLVLEYLSALYRFAGQQKKQTSSHHLGRIVAGPWFSVSQWTSGSFEGLYAFGDPSWWSRQIFPSWGRLGRVMWLLVQKFLSSTGQFIAVIAVIPVIPPSPCLASWLKQTKWLFWTRSGRLKKQPTQCRGCVPWMKLFFLFHMKFRMFESAYSFVFFKINWGGVLLLATAAWLPLSFTASGWYRESQESTWCLGDYTTQLCRGYFINFDKEPY